MRDDDERFLLPGPLLGFDDPRLRDMVLRAFEPEFLDVCAAELDGEPVDCGDGTSATVLPLNTPLRLIGAAVDPGPRCARLLDWDDDQFPLRLTFDGYPDWIGLTVTAVGEDAPWYDIVLPQRVDPTRIAEQRARGNRIVDHCVAVARPPTPGELLEIRGRAHNAIAEGWSPLEARVLAPAPPAGERPATTVNTITDRRVRINAWTRPGVEVAATVVVRDPSQPALTSQCPGVESRSLEADPDRIVELAPGGRVGVVAPVGSDPAFDAIERFATELDPSDGAIFELCLRWEELVGGARRVVDREAHILQPPERPTVQVVATEGSFVDPDRVAGLPRGAIVLFQADGSDERCTMARIPGATLDPLPHELCRFEVTDGLQGGRLELLTSVRGDYRDVQRRTFRVRLVTDPAHPRHGQACDRCVDLYDLPLSEVDSGRQIGRIQVAVVSTGRSSPAGWVVFPVPVDVRDRDFPVLDGARTQVLTRVDGQDRNVLGVDIVADRPVTATLVARPRGTYDAASPPPPGCPAERIPHVATTDILEQAPRVVIDTACALTGYHLALELRDERGNRAVYGDALTWLVGTEHPDVVGWLQDGNLVPGVWNPRVTTPGRQWRIDWEVRVDYMRPETALFPGVYAGPPQGPSGRVERPGGVEADRTRIIQVEALAGPIHISRGRGNGPTPCVDQSGKRFRLTGDPLGRAILRVGDEILPVVEVGDHLPVRAHMRMESLRGGPFTPLDGFNRCKGDVNFLRHGTLPSAADGGRPVLLADDVEEAGQASIVLHAPSYMGDGLHGQFQMLTDIRVWPVDEETP
ncbi:MAG: hypothetical protein JJT89_00685 [Nitriliruptoraceae bacterium]|nr:hypothetical protein [Nitriliruptoraceae bacterium]